MSEQITAERLAEWRKLAERPAMLLSDITRCAERDGGQVRYIPDGGRPYSGQPAVQVAAWVMEMQAAMLALLDEMSEPEESTWTCVYGRCGGASFTGTPDAASAWMDQHVVDHPHDARWAAPFRIDYPGRATPGVAYRAAVRKSADI